MSNIFWTSDTHYCHANVVKFDALPHASVEEMNEHRISIWNSQVKRGDTVYHLGDLSLGKLDETLKLLKRLNGRIHLIKGNHDHVIRKVIAADINALAWVKDVAEVKVNDQLIFMSHYAHRVWPKCHYGSWHLFGHSHGSMPPLGKSFDVGWNVHNRLLTFDDVAAIMETKTFEPTDRHTSDRVLLDQEPLF